MTDISESFYDPNYSSPNNPAFALLDHLRMRPLQFYSDCCDGCVPEARCNSAACWSCAIASYRWLIGQTADEWMPKGPLIEAVSRTDWFFDMWDVEQTQMAFSAKLSEMRSLVGAPFRFTGSGSLDYLEPNVDVMPWMFNFHFLIELIGVDREYASTACDALEKHSNFWTAEKIEPRRFVKALADATVPAALRHLLGKDCYRTSYPQSDQAVIARIAWLNQYKSLDLTYRGQLS